ncbi:MAG: proprotein convertase P-domain-containing protein [Polyangiaceae bacterium]|nr:proprotein convertase P-domain-containing protein [Polyangiaceae bacterium]
MSGVPAGLFELSLSDRVGEVYVAAWNASGGGYGASVGRGSPAVLEVVDPGEVQMRMGGPGYGRFGLRPAPHLAFEHQRFTGRAAIPNGDSAGLSDSIVISGSAVTSISSVTVEVYAVHGRTGEVSIELVAPNGTPIALASMDAYASYAGAIFDDYALDPEKGVHLDGEQRRKPIEPLHVLRGTDANGTWTLRIVDALDSNFSNETGELLGWGIDVR